MTISAALAEVYATAPIDRHYIETLTLTHPIFIEGMNRRGDFFMTNQRDGFTGTLEVSQ